MKVTLALMCLAATLANALPTISQVSIYSLPIFAHSIQPKLVRTKTNHSSHQVQDVGVARRDDSADLSAGTTVGATAGIDTGASVSGTTTAGTSTGGLGVDLGLNVGIDGLGVDLGDLDEATGLLGVL